MSTQSPEGGEHAQIALDRAADAAVRRAITSPEFRHVLRETISTEMRNAFVESAIRIGIDAKDPIGQQSDMLFLRNLRLASLAVRSKAWTTLISVLVAGLAGLVWLAISSRGPG
jgi:hypothetical protein